MKKGISVLMPTFNQGAFICGAINSLINQTFTFWELIVIDDASEENIEEIIMSFKEVRIRYLRNESNLGIGKCLNIGLSMAIYDLITYLPSDDIIYSNHLSSLYEKINITDSKFVYSGILHHYTDTSNSSGAIKCFGKINSFSLQLVQVLHKRTKNRWIERQDLVTSNLDLMFWNSLGGYEAGVPTNLITAEWNNHPFQRHKVINENLGGGISLYKYTYNVTNPIRFLGTGNFIDEIGDQKLFKSKKRIKKSGELKILLVGELSFNPERILSLEDRGHQLFGLWIRPAGFLCSIGPFPFGNITTLQSIKDIYDVKPDIIYGLLNFSSIPLAHKILLQFREIPFVWHFKESPFMARQNGTWNKLIDLYNISDGQIYINEISKRWFQQYLTSDENRLSYLLDGDLPSKKWFNNCKSPLISSSENAYHTVLAGRPYGINPEDVKVLANQNIHLHFYGNYQQNSRSNWIAEAKRLAPNHFHLHNHCEPKNWVKEFSKYDAGWLHIFESNNEGELCRTTWNDLNFPARLPVMISAGLPILFKYSKNQICATQNLLETLNMAVFFKSVSYIKTYLDDTIKLSTIRDNVWKNRMSFTFEENVDGLICFFKSVIEIKKSNHH